MQMNFIIDVMEALWFGIVIALLLFFTFYPVTYLEITKVSADNQKRQFSASIFGVVFCLLILPKRTTIIGKRTKNGGRK